MRHIGLAVSALTISAAVVVACGGKVPDVRGTYLIGTDESCVEVIVTSPSPSPAYRTHEPCPTGSQYTRLIPTTTATPTQ